jgi:hypothetical protein
MIKYYPLTRIKTDLYTRGNVYRLPNGKAYVGKYYITYKGEAFTGANPVVGTNQPLSRIQGSPDSNSPTTSLNSNLTGNLRYNDYNIAISQNTDGLARTNLQDIKPYYPIPVTLDYQVGYFTRYFAKIVTGPGYIFEISQSDYANIQNNNLPINFRVYETTNMLWQLTGPLTDTRVSQYQIKGGIINTNRRVTEQKALTFKGLVEFIGGDYTKFARPTT